MRLNGNSERLIETSQMGFSNLTHLTTILTTDEQYQSGSQRKDSYGVSRLRDNGTLYSDPKDKTDILNKQYCSVGQT